MEEYKLAESEYRFMCIIWENEPLASGELVKLCDKKLGWKKSTTYTVLKKLCDRGFTENRESVVTALVSREKAQRYASERFVENTFSGSLPGFLTAFFEGKRISEKEAEELKKLIDEYRED